MAELAKGIFIELRTTRHHTDSRKNHRHISIEGLGEGNPIHRHSHCEHRYCPSQSHTPCQCAVVLLFHLFNVGVRLNQQVEPNFVDFPIDFCKRNRIVIVLYLRHSQWERHRRIAHAVKLSQASLDVRRTGCARHSHHRRITFHY